MTQMQFSARSLRLCFWHSWFGYMPLVASISSPVENSARKTSLHLATGTDFATESPIHQITLRTCLRFRYFSMRSFYLFITKQVDTVYVNAAWIFVVFRALHSVVHCIFNLIILRFYLYLFGTLAVWFIAIRSPYPLSAKKSLWLSRPVPTVKVQM